MHEPSCVICLSGREARTCAVCATVLHVPAGYGDIACSNGHEPAVMGAQ